MSRTNRTCLVCLRMNVKLTSLMTGSLRHNFELISGIDTSNAELPQYLCFECVAHVRRFIKFRDKCHRSVGYLHVMLSKNNKLDVSYLMLEDRKDLQITPDLSYLNEGKTYYEEIIHEFNNKNERIELRTSCIPVIHYGIDDSNGKNDIKSEDVKLEIDVLGFNELDDVGNDFNREIDDDISNFSEVSDDNRNDYAKDDKQEEEPRIEENNFFLHPLSIKEARAVAKIYNMKPKVGNYNCTVCNKSFTTRLAFTHHIKLHEKYKDSPHRCDICHYYFESEQRLQSHNAEQHMYKYVCKLCPEVNYDSVSAGRHMLTSHKIKMKSNVPKVKHKTKKSPKIVKTQEKVRKQEKPRIMDDLFDKTSITHEEQYSMVRDRMKSKNYINSPFTCQLCFKGFKREKTFDRHMLIHDPAISGKYQCDMCKLCCKNKTKIFKHISTTHLYQYSCRSCSFISVSNSRANIHARWHQNVTYPCSYCDKVFTKPSTCFSHIRIHHPSMYICKLCGHSFINENGLNHHIKRCHKEEEINPSEPMPVDKTSELYCAECNIQFVNEVAFETHLRSSNKHVSFNFASQQTGPIAKRPMAKSLVKSTSSDCTVCGKYLLSYELAKKHYKVEHPGVEFFKRYMCDYCAFRTANAQTLSNHINRHTKEKEYKCPICDKSFVQSYNMKRHIRVHTGEKPYVCEHCNRAFSDRNAMKLHIKTVHLKIPHLQWSKAYRMKMKEAKRRFEEL